MQGTHHAPSPGPVTGPGPARRGSRSDAGWLTGLDGLRAIAVVAVMLFHADLGAVSGGFLGVDVFFVISGFLITTLLLREHASTGRINLPAFWRRRARRLLPALFLLLAGVATFAVVAVPDALAGLGADTLAALGYATNWYLILDHQSYFETVGRPSLLRHLWSLAVEEQFYLVWPIVLAIALALVRRRGALMLTVLIAAASVAWTAVLFDPDADPSRVYYGTDTRLFTLLTGAVLAFILTARRAGPGPADAIHARLRWPDLVSAVGLGGLAWAFLTVDQFDGALYPWGSSAVAIVAAAVIAGVTHPGGRIGARLLDAAPIRWIGRRSYGIYLWHWPVFVLARPALDLGAAPVAGLALRLIVTLALAEMSHRFVELPIRGGGLAEFSRRTRRALRGSAWAGTGVLAASAALVIAVMTVTGRVIASPAALPEIVPMASFQGVVVADESSPAVIPAELTPVVESPTAPRAPEPAGAAPTSPRPSPPPPSSSAPPSSAGAPAPGTVAPEPAGVPSAATPSTTTSRPVSRPTPRPAATAAPTPVATAASAMTPTPVSDLRVFAIGDSVLLGAVQELGHALGRLEVDAEIGRQMSTALAILDARRASGRLPDVVVVHLGNNGALTVRQINEMFDLLAGVPHVAVLTLRIPDEFETHNNRLLVQIARVRANAIVVDWFAASDGRPELFWKDGEHLRPEGAQVYASLIASTLREHGVATR